MIGRGGGAQGGHSMAQAMLREGHHIHVALHHPDLTGRPNCLAPLEKPVERLALDEERRLGRVEVLGLLLAQAAGAEPNDITAATQNREHEPMAKTVVALGAAALLRGDHKARLRQVGVVVISEDRLKGLPALGRKTEVIPGRRLACDAAALEVIDGLGRLSQPALIELRGREHPVLQAGLQLTRGLARFGGLGLSGHLEA